MHMPAVVCMPRIIRKTFENISAIKLVNIALDTTLGNPLCPDLNWQVLSRALTGDCGFDCQRATLKPCIPDMEAAEERQRSEMVERVAVQTDPECVRHALHKWQASNSAYVGSTGNSAIPFFAHLIHT